MLSLKSGGMSRVRPSYNPRAPLNHYPPPSQESNERTMDGSEWAARREKDQTKRRRGKRKRGDEMEWRLLIENENGKKQNSEKQAHGRKDDFDFDSTVAAADLHTG